LELNQFIGRTPRFEACDDARFIFSPSNAQVRLQSRLELSMVEVIILRGGVLRRQLSSLAQICTSSRLYSMTENLYIYETLYYPPSWKGKIENSEWLGLLRPFTAVKNLYLSNRFAPRIAPALQVLTGKCCLLCIMFLLRGSVPRHLSTKALRSSFPHDSSPITLSPFLSGKIETWCRTSRI
jgi:hypothetical protein